MLSSAGWLAPPWQRVGLWGASNGVPAAEIELFFASFTRVPVMAVPKRRTSNMRSRTRRAHHFVTPKQLQNCPRCSHKTPSHVICEQCGHYMGRAVVEMDDAQ
jgi:large subunit ribosomal protein L32